MAVPPCSELCYGWYVASGRAARTHLVERIIDSSNSCAIDAPPAPPYSSTQVPDSDTAHGSRGSRSDCAWEQVVPNAVIRPESLYEGGMACIVVVLCHRRHGGRATGSGVRISLEANPVDRW